jgi:hypothetical protein
VAWRQNATTIGQENKSKRARDSACHPMVEELTPVPPPSVTFHHYKNYPSSYPSNTLLSNPNNGSKQNFPPHYKNNTPKQP